MAMMDDLVSDRIDRAMATPQFMVHELDAGLFNIAVLVQSARSQVLFGPPGGRSDDCDVDEVSARLDALLAYVASLGPIVDRLEALHRPPPAATTA